jgi:hypothetical protein
MQFVVVMQPKQVQPRAMHGGVLDLFYVIWRAMQVSQLTFLGIELSRNFQQ